MRIRTATIGKRATCIGLLALLVTVGACTTIWQPVPPTLSSGTWSLRPPAGWMHLTTPTYEMLSRDGPYLQYIFIQEQPLNKSVQHAHRKIEAGMLPHEAAEVVRDALMSDTQIGNFSLLHSKPAKLGGRVGFRLVYTYTDHQGVDMTCDHYGVLLPHAFFSIRYSAATRFYYDKDAAAFAEVLSSLRFIDPKK